MEKNKENFSLVEHKTFKDPANTAGSFGSRSKNNNDSSSDEDEDDWVDMEKIDDLVEVSGVSKAVQITIKRPKSEAIKKQESEAEKWEKEIRLEIARHKREMFEDFHKVFFF